MYRIVFVKDVEFGALSHDFMASSDMEARKQAPEEIKKLKSQYGENIFIRRLQRVDKITSNGEKATDISFGRYWALIHWEVKGDSITYPWKFIADNDQDAIAKAWQHIEKLDQDARREAAERNENRDGWPSLWGITRIDDIKLVEQEITTHVPVK